MTAKLTAMVLAGSMALSTAFAPTQAAALDERQLGQLLAGALTLFVIGKAIEDSNKKKSKPKASTVWQDRQDSYERERDRRARLRAEAREREARRKAEERRRAEEAARRRAEEEAEARRAARRTARYTLPEFCLRPFETRSGTYNYFGKRCLERNFAHADRLPKACEITVRSPRGRRNVYVPSCLRAEGYRVARS